MAAVVAAEPALANGEGAPTEGLLSGVFWCAEGRKVAIYGV